jgi:hypothetical protein
VSFDSTWLALTAERATTTIPGRQGIHLVTSTLADGLAKKGL